MKKISNYVAGYRKMFGITQGELAKSVGIGVTSLCHKERGAIDWTGHNMVTITKEFQKYKDDLKMDDIFFILKDH